MKRLRRWLEASPNRRILGAAATVALATFAVKAAALVRDLAVAHRFGTSNEIDAFFTALLLPTFAINVVAGSLSAAFVPVYIERQERHGRDAADRLLHGVLAGALAMLAIVTLALAVTAPWTLPLIGATFGAEKLALTRTLFYALLPAVLLSGVATVYTGVLNARGRFALGAAAPMAVPVLSLGAVVLSAGGGGAAALTIGTVLGYLAAAALLACAVAGGGASIRPRWHGWTPELGQVIAQFLPVASGAVLLSSTTIVDHAMASTLPPGSVSALNYGSKVVTLLTGLGTMALGTAVLPHFARMVAHEDWAGLRETLATWIRVILLVTVPGTIGLIVLSPAVVRVIFERGAFTATDTAHVSALQAMYLLQVPFYALGILFVRTLTALQRNRFLLWGNLISFPLNAVLNLLFMRWLGLPGIALSTSVVYATSCVYLGLSLRSALHERAGRAAPRTLAASPALAESR